LSRIISGKQRGQDHSALGACRSAWVPPKANTRRCGFVRVRAFTESD
jgi:hypothetical protein